MEGHDDRRFCQAILRHLSLRECVQVVATSGKQRMAVDLRALLASASDLTAIGLLRDADSSAPDALRSAQGAFAAAGIKPPNSHAQFGIGHPRPGIFILPDGVAPGMIETLCWNSVAESGAHCVEQFLACVASQSMLHAPDKARVHAWLAAQVRPGLRIGEAADAGIWDWAHPSFAPLINFLRQLATV